MPQSVPCTDIVYCRCPARPGFFGKDNTITDQNLIDSAYINAAVFGFFMLCYCL